jgi:phosphate transport system substrate-binding protein
MCLSNKTHKAQFKQHTHPLSTVLFFLLCLLIISSITGCTTTTSTTSTQQTSLNISGSTALQPLVQKAASTYMQQHPGTKIVVNGGGSKTGLQNVVNHASDVGDSDIYADPALYPDPTLTDHIVCVIPFAMIVNAQINVPTLTTQQIQDIFGTGTITNWSQVGGPDLTIVPVVRPATSGTRDTFRKYILGGLDERGKLLSQDSSTAVLDTVAHTPGAIGYIGLSVMNSNTTSGAHTIAIDNHQPTLQNIISGQYNFWSYEHMYTMGDDTSLLSSFLEYMLSTQVQQQAKNLGYIPINEMNLSQIVPQSRENMPQSQLALSLSQANEEHTREEQ